MSEERTKSKLSDRERQLLQFAAKGFTDQAISNKLGISLATIGTYWGRIRIKLGPLNRTELVANFLKEETDHTMGDLRDENQKLVTELIRHEAIEAELKNLLETMRALINSAPDAILVVNKDGGIQLANEAATEIFGYPAEVLTSMKVNDLMPWRFHAEHDRYRRVYFENPGRKGMGDHTATYAQHADGTEFLIAATLNGLSTKAGSFATCMIRKV